MVAVAETRPRRNGSTGLCKSAASPA